MSDPLLMSPRVQEAVDLLVRAKHLLEVEGVWGHLEQLGDWCPAHAIRTRVPLGNSVSRERTCQLPASDIQAVHRLRERTGKGLMECRRVLHDCMGDIEAAEEKLRRRRNDDARLFSTTAMESHLALYRQILKPYGLRVLDRSNGAKGSWRVERDMTHNKAFVEFWNDNLDKWWPVCTEYKSELEAINRALELVSKMQHDCPSSTLLA